MHRNYGPRLRILTAGIVMVIWMIGYAALAVTVIGWIDAHPIIEGVLYAVLGVSWIFPMIRLFTWASKDDEAQG